MITSRKDYKEYLAEDIKRTGLDNSLKSKLIDRRYKFYKSLRLTEYYTNCSKSFFNKMLGKILRYRHAQLCDKYGWSIPINVFGAGLAIVHTGPIVVSGHAKIGKNCRIHICTNIGSSYIKGGTESGAPIIGDNVYIGPGAKIFGPIVIGDNTSIGANAIVGRDFKEGNYTIAGIPAKVISNKTSDLFIIK